MFLAVVGERVRGDRREARAFSQSNRRRGVGECEKEHEAVGYGALFSFGQVVLLILVGVLGDTALPGLLEGVRVQPVTKLCHTDPFLS